MWWRRRGAGDMGRFDVGCFEVAQRAPTAKGEAMDVKIIKDNAGYAVAMARLTELMALDPGPGSQLDNELQLLALVLEEYERKTVPPAKFDPLEFILFRMDQMQLSRKDLIPFIGSISKVSEVLSRKRPLSLPMIRRLHKGLGIPADILIGEMCGDLAPHG